MYNKEVKKIITNINDINTRDFRELKEAIDIRLKSKKISYILETPIKDLVCLHCQSIKFIRWGKRNDMQRYKCKECNKTFNSLTNTPLARLRKKGRWLDYTNCIKQGLTVRNAANKCGIHKNTSFRWRHRFLENFKVIKSKSLAGIIETSESIFRESFKGEKKLDQTKIKERKDVFIIYSVDRNNNIFDISNKGFSEKLLQKEFLSVIKKDSLLIFEENLVYNQFSSNNKLNFKEVSINETKKDISNIISIINYRNVFENWIHKHFRGVATKYLENYVSWYRCLKEFRNGINPLTLLYRAKQKEKYRHQPLKVTSHVM